MKKSSNQSAFPSPTGNPMQDGSLTVRDYFAGQAISGLAPDTQSGQALAEWAYELADAMLAEREK